MCTIFYIRVSEVYADPSHASYKALQFAYGVFSTFTPKVSDLHLKRYSDLVNICLYIVVNIFGADTYFITMNAVY